MKTASIFAILINFIFAMNSCVSPGAAADSAADIDGHGISALGAIGGLEAAISAPMYSGDGGSSIRLAILAPEVEGDVPGYLPLYIQGLLNNNFNRFSAVNLVDRQHLDRIITEQNLAISGSFSDTDFIRIGNITNAQYFLFGTIQRLSGNRYSLQLSITEASSGIRRATAMKDGTLAQLEGRGTLLNEATAELLERIGVNLTVSGLQSLLAGNTSTVQAEAVLARGITAQAGGDEVEALFNFAQAVTFDPSQIEAMSRLNMLSSTISGGTISQRILNDIQIRDQWIEAFKETTRFFDGHPPFDIIFDPNLIQIGETDYVKRTVNLGMRIALDSSDAGFSALNALLEGLEKTGRRSAWGFSGWPLMDIAPRTAGTVVFDGKRTFAFRVEVLLINEYNRAIGSSSITLNSRRINFSSGDTLITPPASVNEVIRFNNIRAEDLTPTLTIAITSVNGISSRELNASGYMRIETGDLDTRERLAQEQQFQERAAVAQAQQARTAERANNTAAFFDNAERNFLGLSGYFQFSSADTSAFGVEATYYGKIIPFITYGADLRLGLPSGDSAASNDNGMDLIFAPNIGLVFPAGNSFRIFVDGSLEMGMFSDNKKGIILDWLTPAVNAGAMFDISIFRFLVRYRMAWYNHSITAKTQDINNSYAPAYPENNVILNDTLITHSISIGIGLTWLW